MGTLRLLHRVITSYSIHYTKLYEVVEAVNGEQAIECFSLHEPDIIFMDVMMPVMDGYEATRRIKALAGDHFVPVIFLTAMSDEKALARCIEVGGDVV